MRPGHLGEDPRFLGAVADRLERRERLPVEIEGSGQVAADRAPAGRGRRATGRPFLVADPPLDLERLGVPRLRRVEVARDRVEDAVDGQGEPFAQVKPMRAAPLDRSRSST